MPVAVAMLPVNAAVYVLDGCLVGASDFKYLAGVGVRQSAVTTVQEVDYPMSESPRRRQVPMCNTLCQIMSMQSLQAISDLLHRGAQSKPCCKSLSCIRYVSV